MSESHDPWESARGTQRDEVQAIWAGRGAPPPRDPKRRRRRRDLAAGAAVAAALGIIAFVVVPALRDDGAADRRAAEARQLRLEAAERVRLRREGIPVFVDGPRSKPGEPLAHYRRRLVAAGEAQITANARRRVAAGEFSGPVSGTACRTFPFTDGRAAQEYDPAVQRNRYQCIAFSRRFALSELDGEARTGLIGQPYWLIADYRDGRLTLCKISPRAGEGGRSLATVPVDPACRDPFRS